MSNLKLVLTGTILFPIGYALSTLLSYIIPELLDLFTESWATDIVQIGWLMLFIVWALSLIVMPIGVKILGLTMEEDKPSEKIQQIFGIAFGFLYAIIALLIVYFTWDWTTTMTEVINYDLLLAMFWIGYIIIFILDVIVVPYTYISEARGG